MYRVHNNRLSVFSSQGHTLHTGSTALFNPTFRSTYVGLNRLFSTTEDQGSGVCRVRCNLIFSSRRRFLHTHCFRTPQCNAIVKRQISLKFCCYLLPQMIPSDLKLPFLCVMIVASTIKQPYLVEGTTNTSLKIARPLNLLLSVRMLLFALTYTATHMNCELANAKSSCHIFKS